MITPFLKQDAQLKRLNEEMCDLNEDFQLKRLEMLNYLKARLEK